MNKKTSDVLQATNILCSHLQANGIEATKVDNIVTIIVGGSQHKISVGDGYLQKTCQLDIGDLRSNKPERLSNVFKNLNDFTGVNVTWQVTHRAPEDNWKKSSLKENFEAVLFREKTFRNAPNPDPQLFKKFEQFAVRQGHKLFYKYRKHMLSFGYEAEDFESLARVHLVTFLHRYRTGDDAEDTKNLNRFMKQRMTEVVYKIMRKSDQCCSDVASRIDWDFEANAPRKPENHPN